MCQEKWQFSNIRWITNQDSTNCEVQNKPGHVYHIVVSGSPIVSMLGYGTRSCVSLESQKRLICVFIHTFHCLIWTPSGTSSFHNSGGTLASAMSNRRNRRSNNFNWQWRVGTNFNWLQRVATILNEQSRVASILNWQGRAATIFKLANGNEKSVQF